MIYLKKFDFITQEGATLFSELSEKTNQTIGGGMALKKEGYLKVNWMVFARKSTSGVKLTVVGMCACVAWVLQKTFWPQKACAHTIACTSFLTLSFSRWNTQEKVHSILTNNRTSLVWNTVGVKWWSERTTNPTSTSFHNKCKKKLFTWLVALPFSSHSSNTVPLK